ncbi:MAG: DUF4302 domain-containing protein [Reichenbachiella sp.]|uniref:DUF4302 domain-containing protein n=1 Tax=Reichenbachiella sp. TaxID=2184521 RepID=UPI0032636D39
MMERFNIICIGILFFAASCSSELEKLTPPAERSASAVSDLNSELTSAANGWVLNYQPTNASGVFYMLLEFNDDGTVRIQSDVPGDNDYFFDQVVSYRIDSRLGLELIFETYGVFHFLFEQNSSSFGAEFEFVYQEKENGNLLFVSKTDGPDDETIISLEPASSSASSVFSRELSENLFAYDTISSLFAGTTQQIALMDENISIFWSINFDQRSIVVRGVAEGLTSTDIVSNDKIKLLDHVTGFGFFNGKLVLVDPLNFNFQGSSYSFSELTLNNYSEDGEVFCASGTTNSPVYTGTATGLGSATLYKTLFDLKGAEFVPQSESSYSVNVFFVADANGFSMSESGSINEYFPSATGFAFNYGFEDTDDTDPQPMYAVGLYVEGDNGERLTFLREFDVTTTNENRVQVTFNGNYYPSDISTNDRANLILITDEIFGVGGGEVHAFDYPIESQPDLTIFALYNPCTNYEFLLVK